MDDYGSLDRALHRLVLSNASVLEAFLDLELALLDGKLLDHSGSKHVFVSGLARAGTTTLMRALYETREFSSLTYRDMPFVMAPNLWARVTSFSRKRNNLKERAHGDGIQVDFDSPEALDEVFWRAMCGRDYIHTESLRPHSCDDEVIQKYRSYVAAILTSYAGTRYLSKNNNNLLRFEAIFRAFPNATILVPFREPRQHAFSLLKQHRLFKERQANDSFTLRYMTWLGHHEFGLAHKPFALSGEVNKHNDAEKIEYWVEQWLAVYEYLIKKAEKLGDRIVFVGYERLCAEPQAMWRMLADRVKVRGERIPEFRLSEADPPGSADVEQLVRADRLYDQLEEQSRSLLRS